MKILPEMYLWTGKKTIKFRKSSASGAGYIIFFFNIASRAFVHALAHISENNDQIFMKILPKMYL